MGTLGTVCLICSIELGGDNPSSAQLLTLVITARRTDIVCHREAAPPLSLTSRQPVDWHLQDKQKVSVGLVAGRGRERKRPNSSFWKYMAGRNHFE
jgi:hypothetical protein